jgi:hypothetical protein
MKRSTTSPAGAQPCAAAVAFTCLLSTKQPDPAGRFDPARNAEAFPVPKALISGRREKVWGATHTMGAINFARCCALCILFTAAYPLSMAVLSCCSHHNIRGHLAPCHLPELTRHGGPTAGACAAAGAGLGCARPRPWHWLPCPQGFSARRCSWLRLVLWC